jgi:hypothetical protein
MTIMVQVFFLNLIFSLASRRVGGGRKTSRPAPTATATGVCNYINNSNNNDNITTSYLLPERTSGVTRAYVWGEEPPPPPPLPPHNV